MYASSPQGSAESAPRFRSKRITLIAIGVVTGLLLYAVEATNAGEGDCAGGDEAELFSRMSDLHEAMRSNDLASWYSILSPESRFGRHLGYEEFKRKLGLDDPYATLEGWVLREAEIEDFCGGAQTILSDGTPVRRCGVLVALTFANSQRSRVLEIWERLNGVWYWNFSEAPESCAMRP